MGVGITVAIRGGYDGKITTARFRDLSRLAVVLLHPAFIEGSWKYLSQYAEEETPYKGHGFCAPQEAGMIAIDLPRRQILSHEGYATVVGCCSGRKVLNAVSGVGPHPSEWETRAVWTTLMSEGRVDLKVRWEPRSVVPRDADDVIATFGTYIMGLAPYPAGHAKPIPFHRLPYTLEKLRDLQSAATRIKLLNRMEFCEDGVATPRIDEVLVNLSPWQVRCFPFTAKGAEGLRSMMDRSGFPGCSHGAPGWAEWPDTLMHACHSGTYLERFKRESRRAPQIEIPA